MAVLLEFHKKEENDYFAIYEIQADNFFGLLSVDKIYKNINLNITSTSKYLTSEEIYNRKKEYLEWVINKKTDNLNIFPDTFNYNS